MAKITEALDKVVSQMQMQGMRLPVQKVEVRLPDAVEMLREVMEYFVAREGRELEWLPEYDRVADWLSDNKGRGLFLYGDSGRGKSLLGRYVLPTILLMKCRKVVSVFDVQDMNRDIDHVLTKHIISIDDIGTEEQSVKFGERRMAFAEVMDAAEKQNKLVVVSTNLSVDEIRKRYGDRVLERIVSTTCDVLFEGKSLRK